MTPVERRDEFDRTPLLSSIVVTTVAVALATAVFMLALLAIGAPDIGHIVALALASACAWAYGVIASYRASVARNRTGDRCAPVSRPMTSATNEDTAVTDLSGWRGCGNTGVRSANWCWRWVPARRRCERLHPDAAGPEHSWSAVMSVETRRKWFMTHPTLGVAIFVSVMMAMGAPIVLIPAVASGSASAVPAALLSIALAWIGGNIYGNWLIRRMGASRGWRPPSPSVDGDAGTSE